MCSSLIPFSYSSEFKYGVLTSASSSSSESAQTPLYVCYVMHDFQQTISWVTTVKQNRLIEMRGGNGPKQSRKTQTVFPTSNEKNATLVSMSFAGPATGGDFYPKADQEENIVIIQKSLIF
jgi:hypothetical protein